MTARSEMSTWDKAVAKLPDHAQNGVVRCLLCDTHTLYSPLTQSALQGAAVAAGMRVWTPNTDPRELVSVAEQAAACVDPSLLIASGVDCMPPHMQHRLADIVDTAPRMSVVAWVCAPADIDAAVTSRVPVVAATFGMLRQLQQLT
jgi:hypothetical protein